MNLTLFVYGNGDFILTILSSVNFFMKNAMSFFEVAAVLSLLIFAFEATGIMSTRGYDWTKFIKVYLLLSLFVLTPYKGELVVHDVISNQDYTFKPAFKKVPIGLIVPIAMTSTIMNKLINLYQQNFEIDENLNFTYSGMNFGANFIQSLDSVNSYDEKFNRNLDNYMQNCGFPLLHKAGKLSELRTSPDIFKTLIDNTSANRFVQQVDFASGNPIIKPCNGAIADINGYYNQNKDNFFTQNAKMMGIDVGSPEGMQRFMNAANATTDKLLNISRDASLSLKQAIAMNMIMASIKNGAQSVGNGSLALAAYDAEQFQQYKKSSELSGSASARTVPILVGIGFALLFFLYPVMIFLAIAMGSYKAIGVFFQILVALNLIPLIYEILNYITTYYLEKKLGVVIVGQGYNYDVSTSIYSFTDNMIIAGNYLATATPLIAYAIVSGSSQALTSVFGHINDPAKQQSMQVGGEMARGNINMGNANIDNASYNNTQGNKLDTQLVTNNGASIMKDTNSGGMHSNIGGNDYAQNFKSDTLAQPNFTQMASSSLQNSLSHNRQEMGQLSKQWGQQSQRIHDLSNSMSSQSGGSLVSGSEQANTLAHMQSLSTHIKAGFDKFGLGAGGNSEVSDKLNNDLREWQNYSNKLEHSSDASVRDAFSNSNSLATNSFKTISDSVATSQALNDVTSNQSAINANYNNDFNNYLSNQGLDPTRMSTSEQTQQAQSFVEQKINRQYGIDTNLQHPSNSRADIDNIANSSQSNSINANGLDKPHNKSAVTTEGNELANKTDKGLSNFKEHQGDALGDQLVEQGKTVYHISKDIAVGAENIIKDTINDKK